MEESGQWGTVEVEEAYRALNRPLLRDVDVRVGGAVLDIGTGSGLMLELLGEILDISAFSLHAIDPDGLAIADIDRRLGASVDAVVGVVDNVSTAFGTRKFDLVIAANCIHLFDDLTTAMTQISDVTADRGVLLMSTAFFRGAAAREEMPLYVSIIASARRLARERGCRRSDRRRVRLPELSAEFVERSVVNAGFEVEDIDMPSRHLEPAVLRQVVTSPMFASGALPDFDAADAAHVLGEAFESSPLADSGAQRRWLEIRARRVHQGNRYRENNGK